MMLRSIKKIAPSILKRSIVTSRTVGLNSEQIALLQMAEDFTAKELTPFASDV